jgi:uncharacterized SAM-binding protein YcdF (DUF218 family)
VLFNDFDAVGEPDAETLRRIRHAVEVVRPAAGVIVCAGGARPHSGRFGSLRMEAYLVANGFDPERILVETSSKSTHSNLSAAAAVLSRSNIDSATIVSSPVHLPRVEYLAAQLASTTAFGFSAYGLDRADPPVSFPTIFWQIQHELAAWAAEILLTQGWQDWIIDRMRV